MARPRKNEETARKQVRLTEATKDRLSRLCKLLKQDQGVVVDDALANYERKIMSPDRGNLRSINREADVRPPGQQEVLQSVESMERAIASLKAIIVGGGGAGTGSAGEG